MILKIKNTFGVTILSLIITFTSTVLSSESPTESGPYVSSRRECIEDRMKDNLIPRKVLFGNPDKTGVQLSPDGQYISYLAAKDGVLNIFIAPTDNIKNVKIITDDKKRGIRTYFWLFDKKHIAYLQDDKGNENFQLYIKNIYTFKTICLTDNPKSRVGLLKINHKKPNEIVYSLNDRDPSYFDIYHINISTAKKTLIFKNTNYGDVVIDEELQLRFVSEPTKDGGSKIYRVGPKHEMTLFLEIPKENIMTTGIIGFDESGKNIYITDSLSTDTSKLSIWNLESGEKKVIHHDLKTDIGGILKHPKTKALEAVRINYLQNNWHILDKSVQEDFDYLQGLNKGELNISSRTLEDNRWIISFSSDTYPTSFYLYDRKKKEIKFLFSNNKALENYQLSPMHPVVIKSRDGLDMVNYLTIPHDKLDKNGKKSAEPLPMVLMVHGGPSARDHWGYNPYHQWLADRGYAVMSVNYRGSTGFGKSFFNKGTGEWAAKMHDDLIDSVNWAIDQKIADKNKVGIFGGSYGGYATLVGLTFTPEVFCCGVDLVGPSNLVTLLNTIPPYWKAHLSALIRTIGGDPRTEEGRKVLESKSPLNYIENIKKPLLIGQGAHDPRVKQSESDQIVAAMKKKSIPVTYVLYSDEGHGFARPENRMSFNAIMEQFLAQNLGGKFEPITDDFKNSSIEIVTGKNLVKVQRYLSQ